MNCWIPSFGCEQTGRSVGHEDPILGHIAQPESSLELYPISFRCVGQDNIWSDKGQTSGTISGSNQSNNTSFLLI